MDDLWCKIYLRPKTPPNDLRDIIAQLISGSPTNVRSVESWSLLIDVMQNAEALKFEGRFDKLAPVLNAVFDVPEMTRIAVGPMWNDASDADKKAMVDTFGRYMVTMYAARFKGYSGETFEIADSKQRDGGRVLVITKLNRQDKEPVELSYLMKGEGDNWHVTDVYYNGSISQLAQLRSEFAGALRDGGVKNLKSVLENKIKQLQGGA